MDQTSTTSGHQHKPLVDQVEEVHEEPSELEGEATLERPAPRHIQQHHPCQQIIINLHERTTRHKWENSLEGPEKNGAPFYGLRTVKLPSISVVIFLFPSMTLQLDPLASIRSCLR